MPQLPTPDINTFKSLSETPRPSQVVPFPRRLGAKEFEVALIVLTAAESAVCTANAEVKARKYLKESMPDKGQTSKGYDALYNDFCAESLLWMATRHKDNLDERFFPTRESVMDILTADEMSVLLNHYYTLQLHKGPVVASLTADEMKAWIERIVKDGANSAFFLNSLTSEILKMLLVAMGDQLRLLQMDKS